MEKSDIADGKMRIFNSDGSEPEMCGNGIRCAAKFLYDSGLCKKEKLAIDTLAGIKYIDLTIEDGKAISASVDMGAPVFDPGKIPVAAESNRISVELDGQEVSFFCVSMGNPHAVTFDLDPDQETFLRLGRISQIDAEKFGLDHIGLDEHLRIFQNLAKPVQMQGVETGVDCVGQINFAGLHRFYQVSRLFGQNPVHHEIRVHFGQVGDQSLDRGVLCPVGNEDVGSFVKSFPGEVEHIGDGLTDDVPQTEDQGELDQGGQTAGHGIVPFAGVQLLQFFLILGISGIVVVFFRQFLHLRLDAAHPQLILMTVDGRRKHDQPGQKGEQNNGPAVIPQKPEDGLQNDTEGNVYHVHDGIKKS